MEWANHFARDSVQQPTLEIMGLKGIPLSIINMKKIKEGIAIYALRPRKNEMDSRRGVGERGAILA